MLKVTHHCLAVIVLLTAGVVGPETHVHPGEGPNCETLVHAHAGVVGHTHTSRRGLVAPDEGPAHYINAYSLISDHALSFHVVGNIPAIPALWIFEIADHIIQSNLPTAHAPPGVEFVHLRAPPSFLQV